MMPTVVNYQAPVSPPAYHRVQARLRPALQIDALTLVKTLHLLALCRLAVCLAHRRYPPPLPAGPGGAPRTYSEESLLLIALLRTLWRLSYQDMRDWLHAWPALALVCGLPLGRDGRPRIPCASQQWKRAQVAAAPLPEALFVLSVRTAIGHAPAQHPRPLLSGYRVHTLLCRGSGLPVFFLLSPANVHDAPFARPLLEWAVRLYHIRCHPESCVKVFSKQEVVKEAVQDLETRSEHVDESSLGCQNPSQVVGHPISDRQIIVGQNYHSVTKIAVEIKASTDSGGSPVMPAYYGAIDVILAKPIAIVG